MKIGIPKEIKGGETRVAVSPVGVRTLVRKGHEVLVERAAGSKSGWADSAYREAGATLVRDLAMVYRRADLICKVKEPQPQEIALLRKGHILFTFLHLAGNPQLLAALRKTKVVAIGYETIQSKDGQLPLLSPMSEIAGRLATLIGANFLRKDLGGSGVLLSGIEEEAAGTVGIVGCGHVGLAALESAIGLGAMVLAVDRGEQKLQRLKKAYGKKLRAFVSNQRNLEKVVKASDLLIGAALVPGRRAPQLVTANMVRQMRPGSVIVDVAIDQGGCVETSRATSIKKPTFSKFDVLHCAIPNLPALTPQTASKLLAARVLPYLLKIANLGWERAAERDRALAKGINLISGNVIHPSLCC